MPSTIQIIAIFKYPKGDNEEMAYDDWENSYFRMVHI